MYEAMGVFFASYPTVDPRDAEPQSSGRARCFAEERNGMKSRPASETSLFGRRVPPASPLPISRLPPHHAAPCPRSTPRPAGLLSRSCHARTPSSSPAARETRIRYKAREAFTKDTRDKNAIGA